MLNALFEYILLVWEVFWRALVLDEQLLQAAQTAPPGMATAIIVTIVLLAGAAQLLGQSVVLFLNKVQPRRFLFSLLVGGIVFLVSLLLWALVIWVSGRLFGYEQPLSVVVRMVALGSAPLVFGMFVLIPYAGPFIGRVLRAWSFLVTLGMLRFTFQADLFSALLIVGAGWLAVELLNALIGKPVEELRRRLFRRVTGSELDRTARDLLAAIPRPVTGDQ